MDKTAVLHAEDDVLRRFGITANGDIIRLKLMCKETNVKDYKENLIETIKSGRETRVKNNIQKVRVIYVSWKHFDTSSKRYIVVRADKGGGMCKFSCNPTATRQQVIDKCLLQFWDNRKNIAIGKSKENFHFFLKDSRDETLHDTLENGDIPFTIANYAKYCKLNRIRFFFCSKLKTVFDLLNYRIPSFSSDEGEFESPDISRRRSIRNKAVGTSQAASPRYEPVTSSPASLDIPSFSMDEDDYDSPDIDRRHSIIDEPVAISQTTLPRNKPITSSPASLIVPSFSMGEDDYENPDIDQRHSIIDEPVASSQATLPRNVTSNPAALTSTANDQLVMLMNERKSKLKEEPSLESEHVVVRIRHPTLGKFEDYF